MLNIFQPIHMLEYKALLDQRSKEHLSAGLDGNLGLQLGLEYSTEHNVCRRAMAANFNRAQHELVRIRTTAHQSLPSQ